MNHHNSPLVAASAPAIDSSAHINSIPKLSRGALPGAANLTDKKIMASTKPKDNPANHAARLDSSPAFGRLRIKTSSKGKQESWTVATSARPATKVSKQTCFRIRVSDVGYRVCLVYYDDQGKRREPYLCYLSAKEWQEAKRGNLANFAKIVADKLADRATKDDADGEKIGVLSNQIKAFL